MNNGLRVNNIGRIALLFVLMVLPAWAGTVTGTIAYANSAQTVNNGTLTFSLSQAAVVSGSFNLVTNSVSCYTSSGGQVVGLPDPTVLPVTSGNYGSGTLAGGTYYVKITYWNATGETLASPERSFVMTGVGTLIVTAPVNQPASATGYKVYISAASGTETLQSTITGWANYSQSSPLAAGAALPVSNTSTCSIRFNDELIPSFTKYAVNLVNSNGSTLAGYPQDWYLSGGSGGTVNISQGTPLFYGTVVYPQAIVATPTGNGIQSIAGPLSMGNYPVYAGDFRLSNGTPASYTWKNSSAQTVATLDGNGALTLNSGLSSSGAGVFTNTQMNEFSQSLLNSVNPGTEYFSIQGGYSTDALTGGVAVPNGATVFQSNGIAGYANTASTTPNVVGVYGQAISKVNGGKVWGGNFVAHEAVGVTGSTVKGVESDVNVKSTTAVGQGVQCAGNFTAQPTGTNMPCFQVATPSGSGRWTAGLQVSDGAVVNGAAVSTGALNTGNNSPSQSVYFNSRDSGGVGHSASINADANGALQINPDAGQPVKISNLSGTGAAITGLVSSDSLKVGSSGSTVSDSRELIQSAHSCGTTSACANTTNGSNRTIFGSVALVSASPSTATITGISPAFTSTSTYFCTATPEGATAAIAAGGIAITKVSGSSFTLTGPNTVTTVIDYACYGN